MSSLRTRKGPPLEKRNLSKLSNAASQAYTILHNTLPTLFPSDNSSNHFRYLPLNDDTRQIRLIELVLTGPSGDIQISMRHVSLNEAPDYATISYSWGSHSQSYRTIFCNGYLLAVLPKVARILESLRDDKTYGIGLYWIDSICIDEADTKEKAAQVALMPTIFLQAQLTIGWTDVELSESTARLLAQIATFTRAPHAADSGPSLLQNHTRITAEELDRYESDYHALVSKLPTPESTKETCTPGNLRSSFRKASGSNTPTIPEFDETETFVEICRLLDAEYFSRSWILLELVLSTRIRLRCISIDLAWDTLCDAMETMVMFGAHAALRSSQVENILVANLLRRQYRHSRLSFAEALLNVQGCNFKASHPLDYVYTLIPVCNNTSTTKQELPQLDYSSGTKPTYEAVSRLMNGHLGLLVSLALSDLSKHNDRAALPSWVPNFSIQQLRLVLGHPNSNFSNSKACYDSELGEDDKDGLLGCSGYVVDAVEAVKSYLAPRRICDQYNIGGDNLYEFIRWYEFACSTAGPAVPNGSDALILRFTETIQARGCNHIWECEQPVPPLETISLARAFLAYLVDPDIPETNTIRVFSAACLPSHDRRFGLTATGKFCLLPFDAVPGDLVWIIRGSKVPVLLRNSGLLYKNVGECYVHGIMQGEVKGTEENIVLL